MPGPIPKTADRAVSKTLSARQSLVGKAGDKHRRDARCDDGKGEALGSETELGSQRAAEGLLGSFQEGRPLWGSATGAAT